MEFEVGAGQADVLGLITQKLELEVGAGLGAEQSVKNEGATKEIRVECGVGEVQVNFTE